MGEARPMCVFCRKHPVDPRWRPFCSERCKLQDLAHWADGTYRVPSERTVESDPDHDHETESRERE